MMVHKEEGGQRSVADNGHGTGDEGWTLLTNLLAGLTSQ